MAKYSKVSPSIRFSFKINPASKLKHTIATLSEPNFNKQGKGLIEIDQNGLEITARNPETNVMGYLRLLPTGLINFHCCEPIKNKMVNLHEISEKLVDVADEDTVTVRNFDGSDNLCFILGSDPSAREFAVELLEIDEGFVKMPDITFCCEAVVLSEHLRQLIQQIEEATELNIVSLEVSDKTLNISMGLKDTVKYKYDMKKGGPRGMLPGQTHHAWFQWPHCESLKKASFVAVGFLLCLVTNPPNNIMMRFNLRELGDLVFINEATMILTNSNEVPMSRLGCLASVASVVLDR